MTFPATFTIFFKVIFKQNNNNQLVSEDLLTFILMCIPFKILEIQLS